MQKLEMQRTDEMQLHGNPEAELAMRPGLLILSTSFAI